MPHRHPWTRSRGIMHCSGLALAATLMLLCCSRAVLGQSTSCRFYDDTPNRASIFVTGDTSNCQACRSACQLSPQCGFYSWGSSSTTAKADSSPCFLPAAQTVATPGATIADCATVPGYSVVNGWSHAGDNIFCTAASTDTPASIATARARDCNSNPSCLAFATFPAERSGLTASCLKSYANVTQRFTNPFDSRIVGVGSGMCFYVREGSVSSGRSSLGCYGGAGLSSVTAVLISSSSNLGQCEQLARRHGYAYFAVGNSDVCYASHDLAAISRNGRSTGCSSRCINNNSFTGDLSDDICGGFSAVSLFALTYGNGDLRLRQQQSVTSATLSGRLEVYSSARGAWGTVCDDGFDIYAAYIACQQLGLSGDGATYTSNTLRPTSPRVYPPLPVFTDERNSIFLDNVDCYGAETSLLQCATVPLASTNHDCSSSEDLELTCTLPGSGAVRLAGGGPSPGVILGRVEVYNAASSTWGSVCDDVLVSRTGAQEAAAVCRSLGLSDAGAIFEQVPSVSAFGAPPPGGFFLDDFTCSSSASSLLQCVDSFPSRIHDCRSSEESAVICSTEAPPDTPAPVPDPTPAPTADKPDETVALDCPIIPRYELSIGRERVGSDIPGGCFPSHAGDGPRPIRTTVEQAAVSCDGVPPCRAFNVLVVNGTVADSCMKFSAAINSVNASFCFYKRLADSCEHNRTLSNGTSAPISIESEVSNCQLCRSACAANSQCTTWRWANYETPSAPTDSSPCYLPEPLVRAVASTTSETNCASVPGYSLVDGYSVGGNDISCEDAASTSTPARELAQRSAIACNRQPGCLSFNTYPGGSGGAQRSCLKPSANANQRYFNSQTNRAGVGSGMCLYVKEGALTTNRRLLGCYEDPNSNALFQSSRRVRSLDMCEQTARYRGTTFFALLNGTTCYVDDELSSFTGRSRSTACRPCSDGDTETCGAPRAISVYSITHSNGALRLTGGSHNRGRLEMYSTARGSWGSICDRTFTGSTAQVACRQLGFSSVGASFTSRARGGTETAELLPPLGGVFLDSFACGGLEGNLLDCQLGTFPQRTSCPHENDVELTCVEPADGTLKVLNGAVGGTSTVGRLEMYSTDRGTWGTVCDDNFDDSAATVACNQIGFRRGSSETVPRADAFGAPPPGGIFMDGFDCSGFPARLSRCASEFPTRNDCGHNEDVVLACNQ